MYSKLITFLLLSILLESYKAISIAKAFSCVGKVIGGYYADVQSGCQMFHVCTLDGKGELQDIVFRCIYGTVFEQETRVCERTAEVNCKNSEDFYYLNNELYGPGIIPDTAMNPKKAQSSASKEILDPTDVLKSSAPPDTKIKSTPKPLLLYETTKKSDTYQHSAIQNPFPKLRNFTVTTTTSYTTRKPRAWSSSTPYIVTRTASSTSVSASTRVHIETPISRFSFQRGYDFLKIPHPAPHLRPSLLKFAAEGKLGIPYNVNRRFRSLPPIRKRRARHFRPRRSLKIYSTLPNSSLQTDFKLRREIFPYFSNDNSFKTSGRVMTLNGLVSLPKDFRPYVTSSNPGFVRVSHPTATAAWYVKLPIGCKSSLFHCDPNKKSGFYSDELLGCNIFHFCLQHEGERVRLKESYVCSETGAWFDEKVGKCVTSIPKKCGNFAVERKSILKSEVLSERSIEKLCQMNAYNGIVQNLEKCYFKCHVDNGHIFVESYNCKPGLSYTSKYKKCRHAYKKQYKFDALHHNPHKKLEITIGMPKFNFRFKRSSVFNDRIDLEDHRETNSGTLARSDNIFSDQSSVIENPSPGNIVIEGASKPKKDRKDKFDEKFSTAFKPHTSHAKNKTIRNGTVVEISEISSPDQNGKVTITSIVPKFIRLNGSNQQNEDENPFITPGISVSTFQSKVTLAGVNATPIDIDTIYGKNMTRLDNIFGNESNSENQTSLLTEGLITNDTDAVSSTAASTTLETTQIIEQSTTKQSNVKTTVSTTTTTQLTQDEIIETNFTCRDKQLEQFYADVEAECKVFHYCAPGFSDDQVLDLKFLCTGNTRFDSETSKCQNMSDVICQTSKIVHGLTEAADTKITTPQSTSTTVTTQITKAETSPMSTQSTTSVKSTESTQTSPPIDSSTSSIAITSTSSSTTIIETTDDSLSVSPVSNMNKEAKDQVEVKKTVQLDRDSTQSVDITTISTQSSSISTEMITPSTTISTSKILTEKNSTPILTDESIVETTKEMVDPSTLNTEKALFPKEAPEQRIIMEEEDISKKIIFNALVNESLSNNTNIYNNTEGNSSLLFDFEENVNDTADMLLLEANISINQSINASSLIDLSMMEETTLSYTTDLLTETSTHTQIEHDTVIENILEITNGSIENNTEIATGNIMQPSIS